MRRVARCSAGLRSSFSEIRFYKSDFMFLLITSILLIIAATVFWIQKSKDVYASHPPTAGLLPQITQLVQIALHPNPGKLFANIGKAHGPVLYFGTDLLSLKLVLLNGTDAVRDGFRLPSFRGRMDCMHKEIFGPQGFIWADDTTQKRKLMFKNAKHFELGGKSAEGRIHDQIDLLFEHFDTFQGEAFSVQHAFNASTLNVVFYRLVGEKIGHHDKVFKDLVERLGVLAVVPNPLHRACFLSPRLEKWVPGILSGRNYLKDTIEIAMGYFSMYLQEHYTSRVPSQPRDLVDALMDEVESTTDVDSMFHSSRPLLSENPILPLVVDLCITAMDTTALVLEWVVLYLSHFPHVQETLQKEVDKVVGHDRLAQLADRVSMPYQQAFLQELFRVATVVPFGFHMALEDTEFRGYRVEKGTCVLANFYGIHVDPNLWENPEEFKPERFIDKDGTFVKSDQIFTFGSGRRSCVGESTARDQLCLFISRILQTYHVVSTDRLKSLEGKMFIAHYCPKFKASFIRRDDHIALKVAHK